MIVRPEKWGHSQVGFRGSNASGGRIVLLPAAFWAHVLPKWPLWAHLFYSVFYSVSELGRACFRQARVARAVLPPNEMFRAGAFALPPCAPKSHLCPLPHLGASDVKRFARIRRFARICVNSCGIADYRCYTPPSFCKSDF